MLHLFVGWRAGPLLVVFALLCSSVAYLRTNRFRQRTGHSPWHIHPLVWALAGLLLLFVGTLLSAIACMTSAPVARGRRRPRPGVTAPPGSAWPQRQPTGAGRPGRQAPAAPPPGPSATGWWMPDPAARHELRWFDGSRWGEQVLDGGVPSADPI